MEFKIGEQFYYNVENEPQIVVKIQNKPGGSKLITSRYINSNYSKKYTQFYLTSMYANRCNKTKIVEYDNGIPTNWEI
jgi:hypothetical protein